MKKLERKIYDKFKRELAVEMMFIEGFKKEKQINTEEINNRYKRLRRRKMVLEEFEMSKETKYLLNRFDDVLSEYEKLV